MFLKHNNYLQHEIHPAIDKIIGRISQQEELLPFLFQHPKKAQELSLWIERNEVITLHPIVSIDKLKKMKVEMTTLI